MLRPLTRSSFGKLGRSTRHSSKKSLHSLKNKKHVTTNHQGTPPIRKSISRKSIHKSNLTTSAPKIALSVSSSKGKRLSNKHDAVDVPKTPKVNLLSQTEFILETPKTPLNISKGITGTERSVSTDFKSMIRSSRSNIDDTNAIKKRSSKSRIAISPMPKSTEKHIKCKETETTESKRMTRSSIGKLHQNAEKQVKCKQVSKEKKTIIITENPKRITSCSIGDTFVSSVKKSSKNQPVTPSMNGNSKKPVMSKISSKKKSILISKDSKHMTPSSFRSVIDSTPLVKKTPEGKVLVAPSPLSAQFGVRRKRTEKDADIAVKDSKRTKRCSSNNALQSVEKESKKRICNTKNISPASVQMKSADSASSTLMHNTRKSNSRSLSAKELPKKNSKGIKRKPAGSPQKDKDKNNAVLKNTVAPEDCTPLDCLTMDAPNKRPRRHTVDVCITSRKATNPSTIQEKTKKRYTSKKKIKSPPDISQLSIDCLSTFKPATKSSKKRPKSAPAGNKRKSKVTGLQTPIPKKGTLKRQRWMFNALKEKNEGYEDDIFENQKFETPVFRILNEADDESDSSISTPKFGFLLTPAPPKKTPAYKETISSSDLLLARKNAEEYLYRRNKKRTSGHSMVNSPPKSQASDEVPEKKKLEFAEAMDQVNTIRKDIEEKIQDESEEEDDYFAE